MDRARSISESDKNLWRKIKRNGHFSKRKKELIKHFEFKSVPIAPNYESSNKIDDSGSNITEVHSEPPSKMENGNYADLNFVPPKCDEVDKDIESDSESEHNSEPSLDPQDFCDEIKKWAIDFQIKHTAINALLVILKSHVPENVFPKCARTLVQTPRSTIISKDDRLGWAILALRFPKNSRTNLITHQESTKECIVEHKY